MSTLTCRPHVQQNPWKHALNVGFSSFVVVPAKGIHLVSLAQCSKPALGDSRITHL